MLPNLRSYMTVKAAAAFLGVSPKTLRSWDRTDKLKPVRHPLNRYRLYRRQDLEVFLRKLTCQPTVAGARKPRATAPS
jgi:MerR family transcriptional regulator, copper efflux regulator